MAIVRWTAGVLGCVVLAGGAVGAAPRLVALVPGEWVDAATLVGAALALPADHRVAAAEDGERFVVGAVPATAVGGLGPGRDCHNDVPGTHMPLTDNLLAPVLANVASRGDCTGARGLDGSVTYLEFEASGTHGGRIELVTYDSHFALSCSAPTSAMGFGVGQQWRTTNNWAHTICLLDMGRTPPSEWTSFEGGVSLYAGPGSAYGLVVV